MRSSSVMRASSLPFEALLFGFTVFLVGDRVGGLLGVYTCVS
jgi:hypothetical protein